MRFFVGLAALTYTLATIGPPGWFVLFLAMVFAVCLFLLAWPVLLVLALVVGAALTMRAIDRRRLNDHRVR